MEKKRNKIFINFIKLALPYKWIYFAILLISIILIVLELAFAENSRVLFDLAPNIPENKAYRIIIAFIMIIGLQFVFNFINNWLNSYLINSIRSNVAIVSQDIFIFDGTIYDNIVMGMKNISEQDVKKSIDISQAQEFIEKLPEGLGTKVGERGVKLSQGQKQRIAIARAIIKKAKVLILDEPTASLDVDTEAAFQTALNHLDGERIKIIIAHRLTTIRNADYVIFLDNGRIIEQGTQDELINLNGRFKDYRNKSTVG